MYPYITLHDKQTKKKRSIDVTLIKTWTDGAVELYDFTVYEVLETHDFIEKMLDFVYKQMGTSDQIGGTHEQDVQTRLDMINAEVSNLIEIFEEVREIVGDSCKVNVSDELKKALMQLNDEDE